MHDVAPTSGSLVSWRDPWGNQRSGVVLQSITYRGEPRILALMSSGQSSCGRKTVAVKPEEIYERMELDPSKEICTFADAFGALISSAILRGKVDSLIDSLVL